MYVNYSMGKICPETLYWEVCPNVCDIVSGGMSECM